MISEQLFFVFSNLCNSRLCVCVGSICLIVVNILSFNEFKSQVNVKVFI